MLNESFFETVLYYYFATVVVYVYIQCEIYLQNCFEGVEIKFKNMHYPVIIAATHVAELNAVQYLDNGIRIGTSVTLTKLEEVLKNAINSMEGDY